MRSITLLLTFWIGFSITEAAAIYLGYPALQDDKIAVTWQDDDSSCNASSNKNALCDYSFDLHEIPTVGAAELMKNPQLYDGKIVRVKGRFFNDHQYPFNARLSAINDSSPSWDNFIGADYWDSKVSIKLCDYIDSTASQAADVTLIIQFLDASGHPEARSKLLMTILHIEDMKPLLPVSARYYR